MGEVTNFKAQLDWTLKEENLLKILENSYSMGDRLVIENSDVEVIEEVINDPIWKKTSSYRHDSRILLVAHAGTSSVSICHMLGFAPTPWEWERLVIGHATVNRLEVFEIGDGMTFGLSQLSGNEHLPHALRTY
jgi:hypothetical protein